MPARIRLRRIGKNPKKKYFFRISVYDKRQSRDSRSIEELGYYDPSSKPPLIKLNKERVDYWLSCGAEMSDTVRSLLRRSQQEASFEADDEVNDRAENEASAKADDEANDKAENEASAKAEVKAEVSDEAKAEAEEKQKEAQS